jgi:hypothetical protein
LLYVRDDRVPGSSSGVGASASSASAASSEPEASTAFTLFVLSADSATATHDPGGLVAAVQIVCEHDHIELMPTCGGQEAGICAPALRPKRINLVTMRRWRDGA